MAQNSELLLEYRETVDAFMDKEKCTAELKEQTDRKKRRLSLIQQDSTDYKNQVKQIEDEEKKARYKTMKKLNSENERRRNSKLH